MTGAHEPSTTGKRFVVLGWLCAAAAIVYLQRSSIGVAMTTIRAEFQLDELSAGWIMSGYYWAYALGQLPASWLGQRWGPRRMLVVSVALSATAVLLASFARSKAEFAVAWVIAGLLIAGIFPSCVQTIVAWFATRERAFPSGSLGSAMSVGGALSTALTGWLLISSETSEAGLTWRQVFVWWALPGLFWSLGFAWWYREPQAVTVDEVQPSPVAAPDDSRWLHDPRTWLICGQQFFRAAGYVFYATWFPSYLRETRGVSIAEAGWLTSLPLLGVVLGGIIGGAIIDRIDQLTQNRRYSRQFVGILAHVTCGTLVLAAMPIDNPTLAVCVIALGSLAFALGSACSYAITMDLGGPRTATLFALMNMCGNIGAAICPGVVGILVHSIGWHGLLPFFAAIYGAVALCWLGLDPTPRKTVA